MVEFLINKTKPTFLLLVSSSKHVIVSLGNMFLDLRSKAHSALQQIHSKPFIRPSTLQCSQIINSLFIVINIILVGFNLLRRRAQNEAQDLLLKSSDCFLYQHEKSYKCVTKSQISDFPSQNCRLKPFCIPFHKRK